MKNQKGFTLVEMALYVGICSVLLFSLSTLFATLVSSRVKNQIITEVNQQGAFVMNTITYAVRNGQSVQSPVSGGASSTLIITSSNPSISPILIYATSSRIVTREATSSEICLSE
jgi:type II secretory pathway pseudopilin PulG